LSDDDDDDGSVSWHHAMLRDLFPASRVLKKSENPFPMKHAQVDTVMFVEPRQLSGLTEQVVVNCTGLGARELFGDRELEPIKGQLTVLLPQPDVDYAMVTGGLYMFPRRDGIMLGGTFEHGVETLEVNREAEQRIIAGHLRIFSGMR